MTHIYGYQLTPNEYLACWKNIPLNKENCIDKYFLPNHIFGMINPTSSQKRDIEYSYNKYVRPLVERNITPRNILTE